MSQVKVKENESLERTQAFQETDFQRRSYPGGSKREHYEKPSVKRKKKSEAARKRKVQISTCTVQLYI